MHHQVWWLHDITQKDSLDVEWAHAIAPNAKILLVEAKTPSGANLLSAIDYAASRKDVVAVSMSWGGAEFSDELAYDSHFSVSTTRALFLPRLGIMARAQVGRLPRRMLSR